MAFLKKHYLFTIWIVAVIAATFLNVPFLYIFLGSLAYLILVLLMRLPSTVFWLGYLTQAKDKHRDRSFRMYEYGYSHDARPMAPMVAYGMQLLNRRQYPKGLQVLEEAVTTKDPNPTFLKIARQDLGIAYWCNGDLDKGITTLENMVQDYDILSTDFYTTLAYFYIEKGDLLKAEEVNDEALKQDETCGPAYDNLAQIRYRQGEKEEALELFLKALDLKETMVATKYYLGLLSEENGDIESARSYFTAAHNSTITGINTVTREEVDAKYNEYLNK